jgi:predicted Zn-ribbon and HTH transcriptional regulator
MRTREADERSSTIRQAIADALGAETLSARELSQRVGVAEREIGAHLAHLERSLNHSERTLKTLAAYCLECGFAFEKRERKARPSRCPVCRSERIQAPRFTIVRR